MEYVNEGYKGQFINMERSPGSWWDKFYMQ